MPRVLKLETLAAAAVAARLARDEAYLSEVVSSAPLALISPCLASVSDPLALAAVEDACCSGGEEEEGEEEEEQGQGQGREKASSSIKLLETHWRRLFLQRFGGKQQQEKNSSNSDLRWRSRFEAAELAERRRLESLGEKLRAREKEERARKRSRSVVVLQQPPRPLKSSSGNKRSSGATAIDSRQRIAKKLASGSMAARRNGGGRSGGGGGVAATAAQAAKATAAAPSSSFLNPARPLVRPGNEAQRIIRRTSSGPGGGAASAAAAAAAAAATAAAAALPQELEEVSLFD